MYLYRVAAARSRVQAILDLATLEADRLRCVHKGPDRDLRPACTGPDETGEVPSLRVSTARIAIRNPDRLDITRPERRRRGCHRRAELGHPWSGDGRVAPR